MDVHRSRFVPYPVSGITAIAFSRASDEDLPAGAPQPALKLAIGRENGAIELWNPLKGQWIQETVLVGEDKSIDGLAWTREPDELDVEGQLILGQHRLFSIASSPAVAEWDLAQGRPKTYSTGNFSEVWCFAAQPRQKQQLKESADELALQNIVAGCDDGTVVLLSTADDDLQFKRFLARVPGRKAKCMSITWQNQHRVLAGFMDSTIRVIDARNGSVVRTMSLGAGLPNAPKNTIVWQIKALANGNFVTGDSNGELVFWDGKSHSVSQRIHGHDSECLDITSSADGRTVFSGSNDGKVAVYRQSTNPQGRKTWARTSHRRLHEGQVKSMCSFENSQLSVVVSGGTDLAPKIMPLREHGKERHRTLPSLPQRPPVISAPHARLLVSWWAKDITIWRLSRRPVLKSAVESRAPRKLVAKMTVDTKHDISHVAISDDGKLVAAATSSEVKIFQLRRRPDSDALGVRKVSVPDSLASVGARLLKFSPDGKWLAAATLDDDLQVARFSHVAAKPKYIQVLGKIVELERRSRQGTPPSSFKAYDRTIVRMTFASDSSVLVVGDLSGYLDSWVLEGHEDPTAPAFDISGEDSKQGDSDEDSDSSDDSDDEDNVYIFYGQHWTDNPSGHLLPRLESAPAVLSFRPSVSSIQQNSSVNGNPGVHSTRHNPHAHSHELPKGQHLLWVMTALHEMYEFDVLGGGLSEWSRRNPTSVLPEDFGKLKDRIMDVVWDVTAHGRERLWLYGSSWIFMLNVGMDLGPRPAKRIRPLDGDTHDRKRQRMDSGAGSKMPREHREGLPETLKRYEHGAWTDIALDERTRREDDAGRDEADAMDEATQLRLLRVRSEDDEQRREGPRKGDESRERQWWCTLKYRPILGMVPLVDDASTDEERPLEVVIVERPLWEARGGIK